MMIRKDCTYSVQIICKHLQKKWNICRGLACARSIKWLTGKHRTASSKLLPVENWPEIRYSEFLIIKVSKSLGSVIYLTSWNLGPQAMIRPQKRSACQYITMCDDVRPPPRVSAQSAEVFLECHVWHTGVPTLMACRSATNHLPRASLGQTFGVLFFHVLNVESLNSHLLQRASTEFTSNRLSSTILEKASLLMSTLHISGFAELEYFLHLDLNFR